MSGEITLKQKGPGLEKIKADLLALSRLDVLVGIPQEASSRENEPISNAELLYIHTNGVRRQAMINEMQPELDKGTPYSVAHQMYIQAHGSPLWASPPRPVIEPAIAAAGNKEKIAEQMAKVAQLVMEGKITAAKRQLRTVGLLGANIAKAWFTDPRNNWAPNAPATIKAKGSDRPLIDRAVLRRAITYVVRGDKRD